MSKQTETKTAEQQSIEPGGAGSGPINAEVTEVYPVDSEKDESKEEKLTGTALATKPSEILVREGLLEPQNLPELTRIADGLLKSGCIPNQFKNVPQVVMAMQFLRQLGLPSIASLPRLCVINGSYSLWGEAPKAICQSEIEDFDEFWFDKDYNKICFANKNLNAEVSGALCRAKRKGIPTCVERTFTVDDAKAARLWSKSGPWKDYPKRMLQMRARGWVLKDAFPDKFQGLAIAEYDFNTTVDESGNVASTDVAANVIAERFK